MNSVIDVNKLSDTIRETDLGSVIRELGSEGHILTQTEIFILAAAAAAGFLFCILGLKIIRVWAALTGLTAGFAAGAAAGWLLGLNGTGMLIAGAVLGIILAVLGAVLYRAGVFLTVFAAAGSIAAYAAAPQDGITAGICLVIALAAAVLAVRFVTGLTIAVTSVCGAMLSGSAVYYLLPVSGNLIHIALCAILCIIGIFVQLLFESRKQKKKSLQKAAEIREERSAENEVEKARAMMDSLDAAPEEDEDGAEDPDGDDGYDDEPDDDEEPEDDETDDDMTIIEFDTENLAEEDKK